MQTDQAPLWMRRLARPGAVLARLSAGRSGYGVYATGDRRRRPLAQITASQFSGAVGAGWLASAGAGTFILSAQGRDHAGATPAARAAPGPAPTRQVMPSPDGAPRMAQVNPQTLSPLARYAQPQGGRAPLLEPVHLSAAEILVRDYERSALTSRVTQDWSGLPGVGRTRSAPKDRAETPGHRLDAQARVLDALRDVGPGLDRLLIQVLIREAGMATAERALGWPARTGASALRLALDRLAVHYRLQPPPRVADPFQAASG